MDGKGQAYPPEYPRFLMPKHVGWINQQQNDVIVSIQEENHVLKNKLKGKGPA